MAVRRLRLVRPDRLGLLACHRRPLVRRRARRAARPDRPCAQRRTARLRRGRGDARPAVRCDGRRAVRRGRRPPARRGGHYQDDEGRVTVTALTQTAAAALRAADPGCLHQLMDSAIHVLSDEHTREREATLARRAAAGDRRAAGELVESCLPAITALARHYRGSSTIHREELVQAGVVGLLRALKRYDT